MSDMKDNLRSSLRFEHFIKSAAATAAIGAACLIPGIASAQTAMPDLQAPTTVEASQVGPGLIDYTILANPYFNYAEITRARASGLSDREIGKAIAIAEKSMVPTDEVINYVEDGWSFLTIEQYLNVPDYPYDAYTGKVANYIAAYNATGRGALKMAMDQESSSPMASGSMSGGAPMTGTVPGVSNGNILQVTAATGNFTQFVRLARRAGLFSALTGPGPLTVFAPTDAAFDKIPKDQLRQLWRNRSELKQVLEYHIIPARIDAATAMAMTSPTSPATLEGDTLQVTTVNGSVMINNATVTTADIQASNGIIHAIDTVLMPPSMSSGTGSSSVNSGTGSMAPANSDSTGQTSVSPSTPAVPNAMTPDTTGNTTTPSTTAPDAGTSVAPSMNTPAPGADMNNGAGTTAPAPSATLSPATPNATTPSDSTTGLGTTSGSTAGTQQYGSTNPKTSPSTTTLSDTQPGDIPPAPQANQPSDTGSPKAPGATTPSGSSTDGTTAGTPAAGQ